MSKGQEEKQPSAAHQVLGLIMEECRYWHGRDEARRGGYAVLYAKAKEVVDNQQAPAEQELLGEVILFGGDGDLKEVSWRKGKMPEVGTKLYAAPIATAASLRFTHDGALAECPCCGSLDVGGAHDTVNCYGCGLTVTKPRPLQNACDAWNTRTGPAQAAPQPEQSAKARGEQQ